MYIHMWLLLFRNKEFCILRETEFVFKNVQELTTLTFYVHGVLSWSRVWLPVEMPGFSYIWLSYCSLVISCYPAI